MRAPASLPVRGALLAGGIHAFGFALFAGLVLYFAFAPVAQWQLAWLYLEPVDWPISRLIWWDGWPRGPMLWLPYPLSDPLWFFVPCLVFGVGGTTWYAVLGWIAGGAIAWVRRERVRD